MLWGLLLLVWMDFLSGSIDHVVIVPRFGRQRHLLRELIGFPYNQGHVIPNLAWFPEQLNGGNKSTQDTGREGTIEMRDIIIVLVVYMQGS